MNKYLSFTCILFIFCFGCYHISTEDYPKEVKQALHLARDNAGQLEKVLSYYSQRRKDSQKFKAACFLISNMRYHIPSFTKINPNPQLTALVYLADSLYYNIVKGKSLKTLKEKETTQGIDSLRKYIQDVKQDLHFKEPVRTPNEQHLSYLQLISAPFLINQIENAFTVRKKSPFLKGLSFQDFCHYTLPYNMIDNIPVRKNGKQWNEIFSKYLQLSDTSDISTTIKLYNITIRNLRKILGHYPLQRNCGFEELFFDKNGFDCFPISDYGYLILNACGVPVDIEYNIAYAGFLGRHSQCNVSDILGNYSVFSPESEIPEKKSSKYEYFRGLKLMNLYQICFSKQTNNPYALKAKGAFIPHYGGINSPLIKDVTSESMLTVPLKLSFKKETKNNLAYLTTFNRNHGTVPVTWGVINKREKKVTFNHVIPDRLYFPVYYVGKEKKSFGSPFFLKLIDSLHKKVKVIPLNKPEVMAENTIITRKFPVKTRMKKVADNLIGTVIVASDEGSFSDPDTLFTIKKILKPFLQDITLHPAKPYSYYQIKAPEDHPHINIAEIMFLTPSIKKYKYEYKPRPLPILSPRDIDRQEPGLHWILSKPKEKITWKSEYDGDMLTAPGAYPSISLQLRKPGKVNTVRLAPLNANNGVNIQDKYALYYWSDGKWNLFESKVARYNFLQYTNLPKSSLYWLKNLSKGKEEMPFFIKDGQQKFVYDDF